MKQTMAVSFSPRPRQNFAKVGAEWTGRSLDTARRTAGAASETTHAVTRRAQAKGLPTQLAFRTQQRAREKSGGEGKNGVLVKEPQSTRFERVVVEC